MEENDLQTSIEFKSQLDHLLNTSIKKNRDFELTELYDSKIQDNIENLFHNNESQILMEKESSTKKPFIKDKQEKSDLNMLSLDMDLLPTGLNNLDIESLEQILKSSYPNKKFNLNKSIEENSIALNHALLLLRSYDEYRDADEAAVNETYLNEIEKILDGIQSPEKRSPLKQKKESEIFIEYNNQENFIKAGDELNEISGFKSSENKENYNLEENPIFKKMDEAKIEKSNEDFEDRARKTKNCNIF